MIHLTSLPTYISRFFILSVSLDPLIGLDTRLLMINVKGIDCVVFNATERTRKTFCSVTPQRLDIILGVLGDVNLI